MRVQCMHAVSSLVTVIVMGLVVIYVYAVLGWKLIVSNTETLNYGFDGEPEREKGVLSRSRFFDARDFGKNTISEDKKKIVVGRESEQH